MQPEGRSGLDRHPWLFDGGGDVIKDLCFNISLVVHCTNVVVLFLCFSPQRDDDTVDNNDRSDVYYYLL